MIRPAFMDPGSRLEGPSPEDTGWSSRAACRRHTIPQSQLKGFTRASLHFRLTPRIDPNGPLLSPSGLGAPTEGYTTKLKSKKQPLRIRQQALPAHKVSCHEVRTTGETAFSRQEIEAAAPAAQRAGQPKEVGSHSRLWQGRQGPHTPSTSPRDIDNPRPADLVSRSISYLCITVKSEGFKFEPAILPLFDLAAGHKAYQLQDCLGQCLLLCISKPLSSARQAPRLVQATRHSLDSLWSCKASCRKLKLTGPCTARPRSSM